MYTECFSFFVGIDKYENRKELDFCCLNANLIRSQLIKNGFNEEEDNILLNENATKDRICKKIEEKIDFFKNKDEFEKENTLFVFYFCGRMVKKKNEFFFFPHDFDDQNFHDSSLSYSFISQKIDILPSKHKLILMDGCFEGER